MINALNEEEVKIVDQYFYLDKLCDYFGLITHIHCASFQFHFIAEIVRGNAACLLFHFPSDFSPVVLSDAINFLL